MKKLLSIMLAVSLLLAFAACGAPQTSSGAMKVGICNWVDHASLNLIAEKVQQQLKALAEQKGVKLQIHYDNCNGDTNVLSQIIANFIAEDVDLMIGIASPVATAMQAATAGTEIPVIFAAVSDPVSIGLVDSLDAPGGNLTGTSDYLDTASIFNLLFAVQPDAKTVGLLYDVGQDSSKTPIADAKKILADKGIACREYTGTNVNEIALAVQSAAADGVDALFTPTDNTVMTAELSVYEPLIAAHIPHYTGADSFALNGAFLGYGVDYANLGIETADMAAAVLFDGASPATTPVRIFDNGTATLNVETCAALKFDAAKVEETIRPFCTTVETVKTAQSF